MSRWLRYALIAAAVLVVGYFGLQWVRQGFLKAIMMTSADPAALGQVVSGSMQPITLKLEAARMFQEPGAGKGVLPANQRLSFKIPAAYVYMIDLKEGPSGPQRVGFEVWSKTLDPVALDKIADQKRCGRLIACLSEASSRMVQRLNAGERALLVEVSNAISTQSNRLGSLPRLVGPRLQRPCKITEDADLGMITFETPEGVQPKDACNFIGNPGMRTRDRKVFPPKHFLKKEVDGTPKFAVKCRGYSSDPEDQGGGKCLLHGRFGIWPVAIWFPGSRPKTWDETYDRVLKFLAQHVAERTDVSAQTGAPR